MDFKIQKERNLYLVLRLRGETVHDTNDNVTTKTQTDLHTEHMKLYTWHVVFFVLFCLRQHIHELHTTSRGSSFTVISWSSHEERISSTLNPPFPSTSSSSHSSLNSCTSSCTFHNLEGRSEPVHSAWKVYGLSWRLLLLHNWWTICGTRVEDFPRTHYSVNPQSDSTDDGKITVWSRELHRQDHLLVNVQRYFMGCKRKWWILCS